MTPLLLPMLMPLRELSPRPVPPLLDSKLMVSPSTDGADGPVRNEPVLPGPCSVCVDRPLPGVAAAFTAARSASCRLANANADAAAAAEDVASLSIGFAGTTAVVVGRGWLRGSGVIHHAVADLSKSSEPLETVDTGVLEAAACRSVAHGEYFARSAWW